MKTPTKASLAAAAPWLPADWQIADASAIQALLRGDATPDQQKRALHYIVETLCGTYDFPFRPGPEGERDTTLALGKLLVGQQIVKMAKVSLSKIQERAGGPPREQP